MYNFRGNETKCPSQALKFLQLKLTDKLEFMYKSTQ